MKNINELLNECFDRIDKKTQNERNSMAHDKGIPEARRILAETKTEKAA